MTGFGFIEFETLEDAEHATRLNGREFQGIPLVVEFAKENRPRREPPRDMRSSGRRPGVPVIVSNVSREVSWQVSRQSPRLFDMEMDFFVRFGRRLDPLGSYSTWMAKI